MVSAADLDQQLSWISAQAAGARAGVFGPESVTWRIDREAAIFLGAGRALLLQLAHPWVATAIAEHSATLADPIGRFHRTFDVMFTFVFGSLDHALDASRRLHRRHGEIKGVMPDAAGPFAAGSHYLANEASALLWVHATLIDTALAAHDLVLPAVSSNDRERYYAESKVFAALFGIPQEKLPPDWSAFAACTSAMLASDTLTVTPAARAIAQQLLVKGSRPWLRVPRWYRCVTAHLLPERLRDEFGLEFGDAERRTAEKAIARLAWVYPRLPDRLRTVGPYQEAMGRLAGRERPDFATRLANRFWIGRAALTPSRSTPDS